MPSYKFTVGAPEKRFTLSFPRASRSVAVRAEDMEEIKAMSRLVIPEVPPGRRLEYLARAYGYKSAIAMRAAVMAAIDEDIFLTPDFDLNDAFSFGVVELMLTGPKASQDLADRLTSAATLVNAGLEMARRNPGSQKNLSELKDYYSSQKDATPGYSVRRDGSPGPLFPELSLPDFRHLRHGSNRILFRMGSRVEIASVAGGSPSAAEIREIAASGSIRQDVFNEAAGYLDEPIYQRDMLAMTLLLREQDGKTQAFMTVRFEIQPAGEDDYLGAASFIYGDPDHDLSDEDRQYYRLRNWTLLITYEALGLADGEEEDDALQFFNDALVSFYPEVFAKIAAASGRDPSPGITKVVPYEGDAFGMLSFEQMFEPLEAAVENFNSDDYLEPHEIENKNHVFEYEEP